MYRFRSQPSGIGLSLRLLSAGLLLMSLFLQTSACHAQGGNDKGAQMKTALVAE